MLTDVFNMTGYCNSICIQFYHQSFVTCAGNRRIVNTHLRIEILSLKSINFHDPSNLTFTQVAFGNGYYFFFLLPVIGYYRTINLITCLV
jgi:hypothetical protein